MRKHINTETGPARNKIQYSSADTNSKLIINLRDLSHTMRSLYEGRGSQKRILIILREVGIITQRELTKRLGIQPGSASEVLMKLESSGLITRTESETDRRTTNIMLTERGECLALEAAEQRKQRHSEMFSCLSEDETTKLLALLEKINADWNQRYPAADMHGHREHLHDPGKHC